MTKVATPADLGSSRTLDKPGEEQRRDCIDISLKKADPKEECDLEKWAIPAWACQEEFPFAAGTFMAVCHPLLLSRLNICYPQIIVINEWKEGRVSRADLGIHSWPRALSLDLQRLHWRHLQRQTHKQPWTKPASSFVFKIKAHEMSCNHSPATREMTKTKQMQMCSHLQPKPLSPFQVIFIKSLTDSPWNHSCPRLDNERGCCWPGRGIGRSHCGNHKTLYQKHQGACVPSRVPLL